MKSNLCEYKEAYILLRGDINIIGHRETQIAFKNCAPFTKCITKVDETTIVDDENLDLTMLMYNTVENNSYYLETSGSLWFYSKDEASIFDADIQNTDDLKFFKYKTKLLGEADNANGCLKNATIVASLKYLSNFWKLLNIPLINCKVELKCKWTKYCVLSAAGVDNVNNNDSHNITFVIKDKNTCSCSNFISKRQSKTIKTS